MYETEVECANCPATKGVALFPEAQLPLCPACKKTWQDVASESRAVFAVPVP